jgi:hypothetical protein
MLGAALLLLFQTSWFNAESYGRMTNYFSPFTAEVSVAGGRCLG